MFMSASTMITYCKSDGDGRGGGSSWGPAESRLQKIKKKEEISLFGELRWERCGWGCWGTRSSGGTGCSLSVPPPCVWTCASLGRSPANKWKHTETNDTIAARPLTSQPARLVASIQSHFAQLATTGWVNAQQQLHVSPPCLKTA